jgi:hypothetical protein
VVEATCDGTITPEEAESLAKILESQLRTFEAVDLEKRVARAWSCSSASRRSSTRR